MDRLKSVLCEEIEPELLEKMPNWFKRLREAYLRGNSQKENLS